MVAASIGRDTNACTAFDASYRQCGITPKRRWSHLPLLNMMASKKEQRGVIQFLAAEGVEGYEMHRWMKVVYGKKKVQSVSFKLCGMEQEVP
ncbi:hypothetical protein TNCT_604641 [Trichonephila clavata]|uniref:Uncharacterized protein n=1 Tax=Trichonephila clavata TaxID=2740835 RepID=A0A8X6LW52_TRICU|nr:hypothetical protein TNCT_604641 [Trichonephila clavata]